MNRFFGFWFLAFAVLCSCRAPEQVEYSPNDCKRQPAFISKIGMDPMRAAFSTSEKKVQGLVLLQLQNVNDTTGKQVYQDSSWRMTGSAGPIQVDAAGNCYVAPVPVINTLQNPAEKQNIIYKVDAVTGIMREFVKLPAEVEPSAENPYGILGFAYLCEPGILYASSVFGSNRKRSAGKIYAIDITTGNILEAYNCDDPIGMGISYISGQRRLYYGSARRPEVWSVELSSEGRFADKPKFEFSIEGSGPRGDDKVRRIRFDKSTGEMLVIGVEFNFNLTAPTEKQETIYRFRFDESSGKWVSNT